MSGYSGIYELLVGQKVYEDGKWRVFDAAGAELADPGGVLWRANPGALLMWPNPTRLRPPIYDVPGVGADEVIHSRIARQESQWDTFVPGDVLAQRRLAEDEILLTLIARAVTSGVLDQWH